MVNELTIFMGVLNSKQHSVSDRIILSAARLEAFANRYIFGPFSLTSASVKILCLLEKREKTTPKDLLELTGGTKSNVSQRLNFLERSGLVKRVYAINSRDKRQIVIKLTAKGNRKLREVSKRLSRANMILEKFFTKKELEANQKFMKKMHQILDTKEEEVKKIFYKK